LKQCRLSESVIIRFKSSEFNMPIICAVRTAARSVVRRKDRFARLLYIVYFVEF